MEGGGRSSSSSRSSSNSTRPCIEAVADDGRFRESAQGLRVWRRVEDGVGWLEGKDGGQVELASGFSTC